MIRLQVNPIPEATWERDIKVLIEAAELLRFCDAVRTQNEERDRILDEFSRKFDEIAREYPGEHSIDQREGKTPFDFFKSGVAILSMISMVFWIIFSVYLVLAS